MFVRQLVPLDRAVIAQRTTTGEFFTSSSNRQQFYTKRAKTEPVLLTPGRAYHTAAGDKETSPEFESSAVSSHFCAVKCVVFFFSKSGKFCWMRRWILYLVQVFKVKKWHDCSYWLTRAEFVSCWSYDLIYFLLTRPFFLSVDSSLFQNRESVSEVVAAVSMLSIRLLLLSIILVLVQAEPNNYIRGKKINPASRTINGNQKSEQNKNDGMLAEFQTVRRMSGSKPLPKNGPNYRKAQNGDDE
jgi:hypothetical protein